VSGGWETWSWDESLFAGTAGYYEQGRLPYAPGLADAFANSLGLEGRGRLLDVGCGPGTVTLRLAPLFEAAVGLDPDPGMLDRPRVAAAVAGMLDPGGAVVQVDAPGYRGEEPAAAVAGTLPFPPPPDDDLERLRREYLGGDRRAGQGIRNTSPGGEDQVFRAAGFLAGRTVTVPDRRAIELTIDDVVARVLSSSSTAPHLFCGRLEDFEKDLRETLAQSSPPGRFSVRLPDNILRIWKLPPPQKGSKQRIT
jgi:SAM-dependent methyltransferase